MCLVEPIPSYLGINHSCGSRQQPPCQAEDLINGDVCRHFAAPWQYDGDRGEAIRQLTAVATGGAFMGGNAMESISNFDAAGYILGGVAAVVQGACRQEAQAWSRIRVRACPRRCFHLQPSCRWLHLRRQRQRWRRVCLFLSEVCVVPVVPESGMARPMPGSHLVTVAA